MFVLVLFVLVKPSSAYHCAEFRSHHYLDCSRLGISTFPRYGKQIWVEVLDLKRNNISFVNLSAIMADFPNISRIDIRYNPLYCTRLLRVRVHIASDCPRTTDKSTAPAITSPTHRESIFVLSSTAPKTSLVKIITPSTASVPTPSPIGTGRNHILLLLLILLPVGATALAIACFTPSGGGEDTLQFIGNSSY